MIDSWNAAKLNERITQVEKKIIANDVSANPTGAATAELEKVSIDGTVYSILPVPEDPTELYFDGTNWITKTLLWENEDPTSAITSVSDIDVEGYNYLEFVFTYTTSVTTEIRSTRPNSDVSNQIIVTNYNIDGGAETYTVEQLYRTITISENTLSISNGQKKKVTNGVYGTASSGAFLVPLRIYGY